MKHTKRKRPIFDMLLTSSAIILLCASVYLFYLYKNTTTSAQSTPDEVTSTIDEEDSTFSGIKIVTEISNDITIPFAIQYPSSNYTEFNDKVKKYIKEIKHEHLTDIATYQQKHKEFPNELNISFDTFEHPNGTYSFVIVTNKYIGSLQGDIDIHTFHLDHETGEMPTLKEALNNDEENLQTLARFAKTAIEEEKTIGHKLTDELIEAYTEPIWENYEHFAFNEEGLILYFSQIENDDNMPIISIPYKKVNGVLADAYQVQVEDPSINEKLPINPNDQTDEETNNSNASNDGENNPETESPKKMVALTFDDGPDPDVTPRVLQTLEKYNAKATFFMLGSRVEYYPEIAKMVQEAGHELGNHSWTHPDLTKAPTDKVYNEIHKTSQIIEDVTGVKPYSFRPPYGAANDQVLQQTDLPMTLWDVDTLDWKHRNPQQLLVYVKNSVRNDSIILMHDIHSSTADGLDAVLAYLQAEGYTFVTVSEIEQQY